MLTDEQLMFVQSMVDKAINEDEDMITISTFAIEGMLTNIRTLQQQNKQMKEAFDRLDAHYDFGQVLEAGEPYSFDDASGVNEAQRHAKEVFKEAPNDTADH